MSEHENRQQNRPNDRHDGHDGHDGLDGLLDRGDTAVLEPGPPRPSGRHLVNVAHLVMGIAFLGIVGIWLLVEGGAVGGDDVRWLLPLPWVLGGLAGLLSIATAGHRRRSE